jgi:hypothetical protein
LVRITKKHNLGEKGKEKKQGQISKIKGERGKSKDKIILLVTLHAASIHQSLAGEFHILELHGYQNRPWRRERHGPRQTPLAQLPEWPRLPHPCHLPPQPRKFHHPQMNTFCSEAILTNHVFQFSQVH